MMELVERAIPVIQHRPEAGTGAAVPSRAPAVSGALPAAAPADVGRPGDIEGRDQERAVAMESGVVDAYRTLDRLRTQQAQLTSGALLQQYQRQVTFEAEDSRPATKVLSVKG